MELKKMATVAAIIIALFACACTENKGTEVLNPEDAQYFISQKHDLMIRVPEGWKLTEFTDDVVPDEDVYTDPLGQSELLALLEKENQGSNFLLLWTQLPEGEDIVQFATKRKAEEDELVVAPPDEEGQLVLVNQRAQGAHGGSVVFIYGEYEGIVVTFRMEMIASDEATANAIWEEFQSIIDSLVM